MYNEQNMTWLLGDMEFLTIKRNFESLHCPVISFVYVQESTLISLEKNSLKYQKMLFHVNKME